MSVSADLIKKLREETQAGIGDCKKALEETGGDIVAAKEQLRKIGAIKAVKKADRVTSDGVVVVVSAGSAAILLELGCETDFVARNERFQKLSIEIANAALNAKTDDIAKIENLPILSGMKVSDAIIDATTALGEKIRIARALFVELKAQDGVISYYIHGQFSEGVGKIGAIVCIESKGNQEEIRRLGKQLAMHVVATKPSALSVDLLSPEILHKERDLITEQVKAMNKPESVANKVIDGMLSKFYQDVVLLEQIFIMDNKTKVSDLLKAAESQIGASIKIIDYAIFTVGESVS